MYMAKTKQLNKHKTHKRFNQQLKKSISANNSLATESWKRNFPALPGTYRTWSLRNPPCKAGLYRWLAGKVRTRSSKWPGRPAPCTSAKLCSPCSLRLCLIITSLLIYICNLIICSKINSLQLYENNFTLM